MISVTKIPQLCNKCSMHDMWVFHTEMDEEPLFRNMTPSKLVYRCQHKRGMQIFRVLQEEWLHDYMPSYLRTLIYSSTVECFLGCPSAVTLAVISMLTNWHDWAQELWHSRRSITVTLAALLEEGMRKELTSWWAHGGVPLEAQFSELVEG